MKTTTRGLGLLVAFWALLPSLATAQVVMSGEVQCDSATARGTLGISALDCRGECVLTMNEKGEEQNWSFTIEPEILTITPGSPAEGELRPGDRIVAIDGILITTREGGRRFANLRPGQTVTVRFRRNDRLADATLVATSSCPPPPPPPKAVVGIAAPANWTVGRVPAPPRSPDTVAGVVATERGSWTVAPRVVVADSNWVRGGRAFDSARAVFSEARGVFSEARGVAWAVPSGQFVVGRDTYPTGRLGIAFTCSRCGTRSDEDTGQDVLFFSEPVEITAVEPGGPADQAGIQIGDMIKAVNGMGIETDAGGRAFSNLAPGVAIRLTVLRRNGREVDVSVEPTDTIPAFVARGRATGDAVVAPRGQAAAARPAPPARISGVVAPARPDAPVPEAVVGAPAGMPLRYSGVLGGVEIEVRGNPVTVSELSGARTILINADGLWIRLRLPGGGDEGEGEKDAGR